MFVQERALPDGWAKYLHESGYVFYSNGVETQWEFPEACCERVMAAEGTLTIITYCSRNLSHSDLPCRACNRQRVEGKFLGKQVAHAKRKQVSLLGGRPISQGSWVGEGRVCYNGQGVP